MRKGLLNALAAVVLAACGGSAGPSISPNPEASPRVPVSGEPIGKLGYVATLPAGWTQMTEQPRPKVTQAAPALARLQEIDEKRFAGIWSSWFDTCTLGLASATCGLGLVAVRDADLAVLDVRVRRRVESETLEGIASKSLGIVGTTSEGPNAIGPGKRMDGWLNDFGGRTATAWVIETAPDRVLVITYDARKGSDTAGLQEVERFVGSMAIGEPQATADPPWMSGFLASAPSVGGVAAKTSGWSCREMQSQRTYQTVLREIQGTRAASWLQGAATANDCAYAAAAWSGKTGALALNSGALALVFRSIGATDALRATATAANPDEKATEVNGRPVIRSVHGKRAARRFLVGDDYIELEADSEELADEIVRAWQ